MQTGYVAKLGANGYGFIAPTDGSREVFFSYRECCLTDQELEVGDRVQFMLHPTARGPRARMVRPI
jgi:cold shock CspA family protein